MGAQVSQHALSEFQSHRSGKLSAVGYFKFVDPAAFERKLFLSFYIAMYCSLTSLMEMDCRYVQIGVYECISMGDAAAAAVCRGAAL